MVKFPRRASCPRCNALFQRELRFCPRDGAQVTSLPDDPLVGKRVADRYQVTRVVGDTATRRIYLAVDEERGTELALHVLEGEHAADPSHALSFFRGAEIAHRCRHELVFPVDAWGRTDGGLPFLATPIIDFRTLEAVIRQDAPLSERRAQIIAVEIATALEHLNRLGLVHSAIDGRAIALTGDRLSETVRIRKLRRCVAVGTTPPPMKLWRGSAHAAPERIRNEALDSRADMYGLGVLINRMMCAPRGASIDTSHILGVASKLCAESPDSRYSDPKEARLALQATDRRYDQS